MRLLLITGAPRSGTTAVGYNLALPRSAGLLYEPFNYRSGLREIDRPFEMPGAFGFTEAKLDAIVERIGKLDLQIKTGRRPEDTPMKSIAKTFIGSRSNLSYLLCRLNPLLQTIVWKDPMAVFASRDVAVRHGITTVATVRPPNAVAASYKRLNWQPDVDGLIAAFREKGWTADIPQIDAAAARTPAVLGAMIWTMVYNRLMVWANETDLLHLINVQDVVDDPIGTYRDLYSLCELPWSERVERAIAASYAAKATAKKKAGIETLPQVAHVRNRDLSRINEYGKQLLTGDEKEIVAAISEATWRDLRAVCTRHFARIRRPRPMEGPLAAAS
ncbi:MAG: hypothetical protein JNM48_02520 [Rhodospirillales bacterium]|nr:hypothetical protein [Rhodospirillales bacterium]